MQAKNRVDFLPGGLVAVHLTRGFQALVDVADLSLIAPYRWRVAQKQHGAYAVTSVRRGRKEYKLYMHHVIQPVPSGAFTDHRNRNGLDNRRLNLRLASKADNQRNQRRLRVTNKTGFRGVCFPRKEGRYLATIHVNWKQLHLGYFDTPEAAARAYDRAARQYHGEFAVLNFPEEGLDS